ncbi:enoyl-CoA hydratase family protein [Aldersonia sp. NBC_00410]|uniref:enoyl-CoA hydratase family protein n=1 Tax=Aldersonia sp. NBC_00410 TaxID=2975954 RepID=UPI0022545745|nr:enoyl-CoA hydratase family protein [Aldersonia sp. NBC_00410]MCX5045158.1 enoyl-CoA hydratase family protein [Aldersonia sp. NBC_00410]
MSDRYVGYASGGGFATLTLDSPHNRNAISGRLVTQLREGLATAAADEDVRAVLLTHTGGTFCAGADLTETGEQDPAVAADRRTRTMIDLLRSMVELPKPIVARIDGHVRAGGMGIVAACDIAVAGPSSTFALTEARIGVAPYMISLTLLPRLNSRAASRYYLTGEKFGAATAAEIGLITIAAQDAETAVAELAAELGKASPRGLAESKRLLNAAVLARFDAEAAELADRSARAFGSPDAVEGITAFLQKRPPRWAL